MSSWFSPQTEKRTSSIQGRGLFARVAIPAGEVVAVKGGSILDAAAFARLRDQVSPAEIQIEHDLYITPRTADEVEASLLCLNHSCDPNVGVRGQITFVTIRDVPAGAELTIDYAMIDGDASERMPCACGAPDCRQVITGDDWRLPHLQRRYAGYFSRYLADRVNGAVSGSRPASPWTDPDRWTAALTQEGCLVCQQTPATRPPSERAIADLGVSRLIADREACLKGYCCLVLQRHVVEPFELSDQESNAFMRDLKLASRALKRVTDAVKINYEIHGNTIPHLHVHLYPRQIGDPFDQGPVDWRRKSPTTYAAGEFEEFIERMKAALAAVEPGAGAGESQPRS